MATTKAVQCAHCGKWVDKDTREFNRSTRLGRPLYCTRRCSALVSNTPIRAVERTVTCPCGKTVTTITKKRRAPTHCSRECASLYSVTEHRREAARESGTLNAANLISPVAVLKKREAWKYAALEAALVGRPHEFEYPLSGFVFDLALLDTLTLVEFDGRYHGSTKQRGVDAHKEHVARSCGFTLIRRREQEATVLHPDLLKGL